VRTLCPNLAALGCELTRVGGRETRGGGLCLVSKSQGPRYSVDWGSTGRFGSRPGISRGLRWFEALFNVTRWVRQGIRVGIRRLRVGRRGGLGVAMRWLRLRFEWGRLANHRYGRGRRRSDTPVRRTQHKSVMVTRETSESRRPFSVGYPDLSPPTSFSRRGGFGCGKRWTACR
jgi:hypothetical protein